MSLEAWGDEGDYGPDGYVTEEHYEEMRTCANEAVMHLKALLDFLDDRGFVLPYQDEVRKWLAANTVDGVVP